MTTNPIYNIINLTELVVVATITKVTTVFLVDFFSFTVFMSEVGDHISKVFLIGK